MHDLDTLHRLNDEAVEKHNARIARRGALRATMIAIVLGRPFCWIPRFS